tara:strand:- start:1 stop:204 length:204 start_codon:yes stop_codon:yes gene_type:complete
MTTNDYIPCQECGELEAHELHLDDPHGYENRSRTLDCNYEASYEGEENGYIGTCDHHEFDAAKESTG